MKHCMQVWGSPCPQCPQHKRSFQNVDASKLRLEMEQKNWSDITLGTNLNAMTRDFTDKI